MEDWRIVCRVVVFLLATLSYGSVFADQVGESGEVKSVEFLASTSDNFVSYHGVLILKQVADDREREYLWGGARCAGRVLTEDQVNRLFDLAATPYMLVTPYFKNGSDNARCIVGIVASNKKFL
jgi:hypothetical protein